MDVFGRRMAIVGCDTCSSRFDAVRMRCHICSIRLDRCSCFGFSVVMQVVMIVTTRNSKFIMRTFPAHEYAENILFVLFGSRGIAVLLWASF